MVDQWSWKSNIQLKLVRFIAVLFFEKFLYSLMLYLFLSAHKTLLSHIFMILKS